MNVHQNSLLLFQLNWAQIYMEHESIFILVTISYYSYDYILML